MVDQWEVESLLDSDKSPSIGTQGFRGHERNSIERYDTTIVTDITEQIKRVM